MGHLTFANSATSNSFNPCTFGSKRPLFRVLMSIATGTIVFSAICFDRASRVLFEGSLYSFDFAKLLSFSAENFGKVLEGEMFRITLSKPKSGSAQHLRVVSFVPLRSDFQPAIETERTILAGS
ncbi:Nucleic acid-binding, OB-fold containing protein [Quillaja saponaria]|uniref:Nucleic acid-binding, OB-fold containing protein n=1 Tax=Quillaja saponaria TaxID=32244 RepID=A0AAD7VMJ8_QUISA|nr:Nucleic acid-binding, OB-fold containing protein [Quillaja saponaria]